MFHNVQIEPEIFQRCSSIRKKSLDVLRFKISEWNSDYLAAAGYRRGILKVKLTSTGFHKLRIAATRWGKHGNTTLAIPGHNPPVEITIFNDVEINPGPKGLHV